MSFVVLVTSCSHMSRNLGHGQNKTRHAQLNSKYCQDFPLPRIESLYFLPFIVDAPRCTRYIGELHHDSFGCIASISIAIQRRRRRLAHGLLTLSARRSWLHPIERSPVDARTTKGHFLRSRTIHTLWAFNL